LLNDRKWIKICANFSHGHTENLAPIIILSIVEGSFTMENVRWMMEMNN